MMFSIVVLLILSTFSTGSRIPKDECYCGLTRDCTVDGQNLIEFTEGVRSQCDCEALCMGSSLCTHYTWFDQDDPGQMGQLCLFSPLVKRPTTGTAIATRV